MCYTFTEILSFLKLIVYITSFFHSFHTIKKDRELFCLRIKNIYSFLFFMMVLTQGPSTSNNFYEIQIWQLHLQWNMQI